MKGDQIQQLIERAVDATNGCREKLEKRMSEIKDRLTDWEEKDAGRAAVVDSRDYCQAPIEDLVSVSCPTDQTIAAAREYLRLTLAKARAIAKAVNETQHPDKSMFSRLWQPDDPDLNSDELYTTFYPLFMNIVDDADSLAEQLEDLVFEIAGEVDEAESAVAEALVEKIAEGMSVVPGSRHVSRPAPGRGEDILARFLGGNPTPEHLKGDVVALTKHREQLLRNKFEIVHEERRGRKQKKIVRRASGRSRIATEAYGAASVSYEYFSHCLLEVKKSITWLKAEICECDEELIAVLRTQTIVCFESLVEEIRRAGGPIADKVDYHYLRLEELIGYGEYNTGELIQMLGIDVEGVYCVASHRIELSYSEHQRNVQSVLMIRKFGQNLRTTLQDLIDGSVLPWELPQLVGTISDLVASLQHDLIDAGISRSDNGHFEVIDWMDDAFTSGVFVLQDISELHERQIVQIRQSTERWLPMIRCCLSDELVKRKTHLKKSFVQLQRYVEKTEMLAEVPVSVSLAADVEVEVAEAATEEDAA